VSIPPTVTLTFTARVTAGAGAHVANTAQMNDHGFLLTAASAFDVPLPAWSKQINGVPWKPSFSVIVEPEDILTVTDVITTPSAFTLHEAWDSDQLELISHITTTVGVLAAPSFAPPRLDAEFHPLAEETLDWHVPAGTTEPLTLTKVFRVKPGDWTRATLTESLAIGDWTATRPVAVVWSAALQRIYLPLTLRDYPQ
jgi:hypothetical protein